jgi:hypothetical protein
VIGHLHLEIGSSEFRIEGLLSIKFFDLLRSTHRSGGFRDMMKRALLMLAVVPSLAVVLSLAAEQIKQAINRAVFAAS